MAWFFLCAANRARSTEATDPDADGTIVTVNWQSVAGVNYFLERSTNLAASPSFAPLATAIPDQPATTTHTDTNAASTSSLFYRVGVGN